MALDPSYAYYLVGKETAQALTYAQADALPDMQLVFTCTDFSGYSGPPDWTLPDYWQSPESYYGNDLQCITAENFGETGPAIYDMAAMQIITKYTNSDGTWAGTVSDPGNQTGRFLVGVLGPSQALFTPVTYSDGGSSGPITVPTVSYAYSNTDGGQYVRVATPADPYFQPQVDAVIILAAYDGDVPEPPGNFWTRFIGSQEIV